MAATNEPVAARAISDTTGTETSRATTSGQSPDAGSVSAKARKKIENPVPASAANPKPMAIERGSCPSTPIPDRSCETSTIAARLTTTPTVLTVDSVSPRITPTIVGMTAESTAATGASSEMGPSVNDL